MSVIVNCILFSVMSNVSVTCTYFVDLHKTWLPENGCSFTQNTAGKLKLLGILFHRNYYIWAWFTKLVIMGDLLKKIQMNI